MNAIITCSSDRYAEKCIFLHRTQLPSDIEEDTLFRQPVNYARGLGYDSALHGKKGVFF